MTQQWTTLLLSECLTVINSYKNKPENRIVQIFNSGSQDQSGETLFSILNYEVSAAIHIITSLVISKVLNVHPIMPNLAQSCASTFFTVVLLEYCSLHLQKAFFYFLANLLNEVSHQPNDDIDTDKLVQMAAKILNSCSGEALEIGTLCIHFNFF